jgi:hypothetical protein
MRRILFDTNLVLDVLLDRHPHVEASAGWAIAETGAVEGMLAGHAITTIHCLICNDRWSGPSRGAAIGIPRLRGCCYLRRGKVGRL